MNQSQILQSLRFSLSLTFINSLIHFDLNSNHSSNSPATHKTQRLFNKSNSLINQEFSQNNSNHSLEHSQTSLRSITKNLEYFESSPAKSSKTNDFSFYEQDKDLNNRYKYENINQSIYQPKGNHNYHSQMNRSWKNKNQIHQTVKRLNQSHQQFLKNSKIMYVPVSRIQNPNCNKNEEINLSNDQSKITKILKKGQRPLFDSSKLVPKAKPIKNMLPANTSVMKFNEIGIQMDAQKEQLFERINQQEFNKSIKDQQVIKKNSQNEMIFQKQLPKYQLAKNYSLSTKQIHQQIQQRLQVPKPISYLDDDLQNLIKLISITKTIQKPINIDMKKYSK